MRCTLQMTCPMKQAFLSFLPSVCSQPHQEKFCNKQKRGFLLDVSLMSPRFPSRKWMKCTFLSAPPEPVGRKSFLIESNVAKLNLTSYFETNNLWERFPYISANWVIGKITFVEENFLWTKLKIIVSVRNSISLCLRKCLRENWLLR